MFLSYKAYLLSIGPTIFVVYVAGVICFRNQAWLFAQFSLLETPNWWLGLLFTLFFILSWIFGPLLIWGLSADIMDAFVNKNKTLALTITIIYLSLGIFALFQSGVLPWFLSDPVGSLTAVVNYLARIKFALSVGMAIFPEGMLVTVILIVGIYQAFKPSHKQRDVVLAVFCLLVLVWLWWPG
jgi:hypothetical protein